MALCRFTFMYIGGGPKTGIEKGVWGGVKTSIGAGVWVRETAEVGVRLPLVRTPSANLFLLVREGF